MICMDSPVLTLVVALAFAVAVEPNQNAPRPESPHVSPSGTFRPPNGAPPSPLTSRSPRPVQSPQPTSPSSHPPPPPSPAPSPRSHPPPPSPSPPPGLPPPPNPPPTPRNGNLNSNKNWSPPPHRKKLNMGKKIGLIFIGVAASLQVCIAAFLLISRRKLLKTEHAY